MFNGNQILIWRGTMYLWFATAWTVNWKQRLCKTIDENKEYYMAFLNKSFMYNVTDNSDKLWKTDKLLKTQIKLLWQSAFENLPQFCPFVPSFGYSIIEPFFKIRLFVYFILLLLKPLLQYCLKVIICTFYKLRMLDSFQ